MDANENHKRGRRRGPPSAFWIKVALAANFLAPLLPAWLSLVLGLAVLALPAALFRPQVHSTVRVRGMADLNLTESAWQKAKDDAWGVIKSPIFELGAAMVGLVFGAAALIASEGQPGTTQAGSAVFFGVLSFAITLTLIFLVQLAAAPVRQRNELREAWPSSSGQPNDLKLKLWHAYRLGSDLAQRLEVVPAQARNWREAEAWAGQVTDLLAGNVPEELAREFFSAGEYDDDLARQVSDRTEELQKIIEGLE